MKKIAISITVGLSLDCLHPDFYPALQARGYDVHGICSNDAFVENVRKQGVYVHTIEMKRGFSLLGDLVALIRLCRLFHAEQYDLVHYSTPKAAFLTALASRIASPRTKRLATIRGLVFTGYEGYRRWILKTCDKIAYRLADYVISISPSLREEAVQEDILPRKRMHVLGSGSSKGVNLDKFQRSRAVLDAANKIRMQHDIPMCAFVIGYAGRLAPEKGIKELVESFFQLEQAYDNLYMLLVGDEDERTPLANELSNSLRTHDRIIMPGFTNELQNYIAVMDVLVLPSYREGFGNVLIEASAMAVPVIGTDIPGIRDAVQAGRTGLLVPAKDITALKNAIHNMITDCQMRRAMAAAGEKWVKKVFDRNIVWNRLFNLYDDLLSDPRTSKV